MGRDLPKSSEQDHDDDREDADADGFGFLETFDQAVQECGNPEKPFEKRSQHTDTNNGYIDNLLMVRHTSFYHVSP